MSHFNKNAKELWSMEPREFNEWRSNNDLPMLFNYLMKLLPGFSDWLASLPFDMDVVLRIVPTGDLFKGKDKVVIRITDYSQQNLFECFEGTENEAKQWWQKRSNDYEILGEIEPYFKWAKRKLGRKRFFIWDQLNKQTSDKFIRGSCSGINVTGCITKAHLFRDYTLLKLGQICLDNHVSIGHKNLDFCDLDFLTIKGDMHGYGSSWKTINYSSFRELTFERASVHFYTFHECWLDKLLVKDSKLQDFYFEKTNINECYFENSNVFKMGFKGARVKPFIKYTEMREIIFEPDKSVEPSEIAITYRMFRAAYQSSGLTKEASECYFKEKSFERKSYFHPYDIDRENFKGMLFYGRLTKIFHYYINGMCEKSAIPSLIKKVLISKLKKYLMPRSLFSLMKYRFKWIVSMVNNMVWGYGERPLRIIFFAAFVISAYAGAYNIVDWVDTDGNGYNLSVFDSFYYSVVTFSTLGYGDITPHTDILKVLAGSEALLGALTIGLLIAGFSNKNKY
ncbi:two pore domain potassium channel family protein [Escherichia coli]